MLSPRLTTASRTIPEQMPKCATEPLCRHRIQVIAVTLSSPSLGDTAHDRSPASTRAHLPRFTAGQRYLHSGRLTMRSNSACSLSEFMEERSGQVRQAMRRRRDHRDPSTPCRQFGIDTRSHPACFCREQHPCLSGGTLHPTRPSRR